MLDIIIPAWKNKKGVRRTLDSINFCPEVEATIVDDCSGDYYNDILESYTNTHLTVFYHQENKGQGLTRQTGINVTSNPYIMFFDNGDYFIDSNCIDEILTTIRANPNIYWFSWQHLVNNIPEYEEHARLHGRVYSREFLKKYGITFSSEGSRYNEDVGFNRACVLILKQLLRKEGINHKKIIQKPLVVWDREDENSLSLKDNGSYNYKNQNIGLALNEFHVLEIARKNNVDEDLILKEISDIMLALYYHFLCTLQERPEFIQYSWSGAKLFYNQEFSKLEKNNPMFLSFAKSHILQHIRKKIQYWDFSIPININKFLYDLQFETIPEFYLKYIDF